MHKIKSALGFKTSEYHIPVLEQPDPDPEPSKVYKYFRQDDAAPHPYNEVTRDGTPLRLDPGQGRVFDPVPSAAAAGPSPSNRTSPPRRLSGGGATAPLSMSRPGPTQTSYHQRQQSAGSRYGQPAAAMDAGHRGDAPPIDASALEGLRRAREANAAQLQWGSATGRGGTAMNQPIRINALDFRAVHDRDAAPMASLRQDIDERHVGSAALQSPQPLGTTRLVRPFVDEHGVQHYNPAMYDHVLRDHARHGMPDGEVDTQPVRPGVPIALPRAGHDGRAARFGSARADADAAPLHGALVPPSEQLGQHASLQQRQQQQQPGRSRHHAYGVPENVPQDLPGMSPFSVDFSWSTAERDDETFRTYLQSAVVPRDDRAFAPGTAAARGFDLSPVRGGEGHHHHHHHAAQQRGRSASPIKFRASGSPQRREPSPFRVVGLQVDRDMPFAERYRHRGWSHLKHTQPRPNERVGVPQSATVAQLHRRL